MSDTQGQLDLELSIEDPASETRACIAPNRGGMVTTFEVGSRPIFFLDRASFLDPTKNVRGGSPVLFPTPGKLAGDAWSRAGKSGTLKQHGFARNRAWAVVRESPSAVTLRLEPDETTLASYPWDFRVDLTYAVRGRALRVTAEIENRSASEMPFGFGFHPYFSVADKRTFAIETDARRAFDNVTKREVSFDRRALDLGPNEVDLHLLDHERREMAFSLDGDLRVTIDGGTDRPHWVLWSLPGRDFVCVEPWTCPGDAMNTGERLIHLPPGATRELSFAFVVEIG